MNWYIKLFAAPIILSVLCIALFGFYITDSTHRLPREEVLIQLTAMIVAWGIIQALFFPKGRHKSKSRIVLILCVLIYPSFIFAATSRGRLAEEWTIVLFLGAAIGTISFYVRHLAISFSFQAARA
jgi:hypothetical protein